MLQGQIIKASGGFFTVLGESGAEYVCIARGLLKKERELLMVGDYVLFEPSATNGKGIIEKLLPRINLLKRPHVSNVDQLAVIMSLKDPSCDWHLVSRILVMAEKEGTQAFLCLNKTDLAAKDELEEMTAQLDNYPYRVFYTSAVNAAGLDQLKDSLQKKCTVFAGPSGVGKSSLLNAIQPGLSLKTGTVSEKIKRGRHTTRQVELLSLSSGGLVVDTPGFSRVDISDLEGAELADYFPEFEPLREKCGFRNCRHISEPRCAVKEEIGSSLNSMRYEHYQHFIKELDKQGVY